MSGFIDKKQVKYTGLAYTDDEIRALFRDAKNKPEMIGILADMNLCSHERIRKIVNMEAPKVEKKKYVKSPVNSKETWDLVCDYVAAGNSVADAAAAFGINETQIRRTVSIRKTHEARAAAKLADLHTGEMGEILKSMASKPKQPSLFLPEPAEKAPAPVEKPYVEGKKLKIININKQPAVALKCDDDYERIRVVLELVRESDSLTVKNLTRSLAGALAEQAAVKCGAYVSS